MRSVRCRCTCNWCPPMARSSMSDSATDGTETTAVLVIGYGNPLRRDDGVGWAVASGLAGRFETIAVHQLTPELAEPISRARHVVFVDAECGPAAGAVRTCDVAPAASDRALMAHHLGPAQLLA